MKLHTLYCVQESKVDHATWEDEPFVVWLVSSPAAKQTASSRTSPFGNVNTGDTRAIPLQEVVVDIPRYGGLIVAGQVWESDLESAEERKELEVSFASEFGGRTINQRSRFLDALGRAVAPDWKAATLDAHAFLRGGAVEVVRVVADRHLDQWVEAGRSLAVPLRGTDELSLRGVATRHLGHAGGFSVVRDVFGVQRIPGTRSLRSRLEELAR